MTQQPPPDNEMTDALRDAFGYDESVSPDTLEMIMTGYDIVNLDVVVAELVHDSAVMAGQPVRADGGTPRQVVYEAAGIRISLEIGSRAPQVVGKVEPVAAGELTLDQPGNQASVVVSETGGFECSIEVGIPFRLRWTPEDGTVIATDWVE